jgi:hypothetical protein
LNFGESLPFEAAIERGSVGAGFLATGAARSISDDGALAFSTPSAVGTAAYAGGVPAHADRTRPAAARSAATAKQGRLETDKTTPPF